MWIATKPKPGEARNYSFPHIASPWWIPILMIIGWAPVLGAEFFGNLPFAISWGFVTITCEIVAVFSLVLQASRLTAYVLGRLRASK